MLARGHWRALGREERGGQEEEGRERIDTKGAALCWPEVLLVMGGLAQKSGVHGSPDFHLSPRSGKCSKYSQGDISGVQCFTWPSPSIWLVYLAIWHRHLKLGVYTNTRYMSDPVLPNHFKMAQWFFLGAATPLSNMCFSSVGWIISWRSTK